MVACVRWHACVMLMVERSEKFVQWKTSQGRVITCKYLLIKQAKSFTSLKSPSGSFHDITAVRSTGLFGYMQPWHHATDKGYVGLGCDMPFKRRPRNHYWSSRNDSTKGSTLSGMWSNDPQLEAYSVAGETWFGWWLVEHYLSYHVNCPNSCVSGEPTRGRKDPPYFQMSYGSLDHIPDLVDPLVEAFLPLQQGFPRSSLERRVAP